jgi:uncharacterized protein YyaL (SSP411 family)
LLREMRHIHDQQPEQLGQRADQITRRVRTAMTSIGGDALPGVELLAQAAQSYAVGFDAQHGGLNRSPKCPSTFPVRLILRQHDSTGESSYLDMATLTLDRMAGGGIYDQIGGGFHRYSTDKRWLVPHFEKMLYDNALLALAYLDAYQITAREEYRRVTEEILHYVGREMTAPRGAFYSATDADSLNPHGEREEGWFFTWTPNEIRAVLGAERALLIERYYGVSPGGNFEGRTILNVTRPLAEVAAELKLSAEQAQRQLTAARNELYAARLRRPAPLRDDKILSAWNGLMISAFARAGFVLDRADLVERAARAARFVLDSMRVEQRLMRSYAGGAARQRAFLDDHAYLTAALLDLFEVSGELIWLEHAIAMQEILDRHFADKQGGGYFTTGDEHEPLLAREKPDFGGARPSGNSIALMNLLRLHELTTDQRYLERADRLLRAFEPALRRGPTGFGEMLQAVGFRHSQPLQVVIVTPTSRKEAEPFLAQLRRLYLPNRVLVVTTESGDFKARSEQVPLLRGRVAREGKTTAYLCQQRVCQLPTTGPSRFGDQLRKAKTRPAASSESRLPLKN